MFGSLLLHLEDLTEQKGHVRGLDQLRNTALAYGISLISRSDWRTVSLEPACLTKTAEAALVCPWWFRSAPTNSLSGAVHQSLQLIVAAHSKIAICGKILTKDMSISPPNLTVHAKEWNFGSIALNLPCTPHRNPGEATSLLSCLVDPQRLDNTSTLLTSLMKVWHWFLNRPSLCSTVGPRRGGSRPALAAAGNRFPAA